MLDQLAFTGRELLVALILATLIYLVEVLLFSRRKKNTPASDTRAEFAALKQEIQGLKARLEALESRPPMESALDTQKAIHADAIRMAREGASPQELADRLGISRTEADLIIALHKSES
jgi:hypothetical protein